MARVTLKIVFPFFLWCEYRMPRGYLGCQCKDTIRLLCGQKNNSDDFGKLGERVKENSAGARVIAKHGSIGFIWMLFQLCVGSFRRRTFFIRFLLIYLHGLELLSPLPQ